MLGLVLLTGSLAGPAAQAQSPGTVAIGATATPNPVGTDETVTFTLRVEGAALTDLEVPEPPLTEGLTLVQATPATQRNVSFSNGQLTRRITFQWTYRPVRAGTARFHPATITVRGSTHETDAIDIEVVAPAQRSSGTSTGASRPPSSPDSTSQQETDINEEDLFIRAEPETHHAYQNEQVAVAYHLYFREGIQLRHSRLANAWDAPGFWREELDVDSRPVPRSVTVDGQPYHTIVLKRAALFPTRTGSLRVDPLEIETEARATGRLRGRVDPFFPHAYESVALASDALTIAAEPLPNGAPDAFNGAVGDFRLRASVQPTEIQVGRPVRLRVQIEGTGNIATLQPPTIDPPDAFEVYDLEERTSIDRNGARVRGTKTFTYVLVPRAGGTYTLSPTTFAYFDPEQHRYRTLHTEPSELQVAGDEATADDRAADDALPEDDVADLMTETPTSWIRTESRPLYRSPWPYVAVLAPLLLAGGLAALRRRSAVASEAERDTASLQQARRHMQNRQSEACYGAIERAVLGFIGERLGIAASGLTRAQLDAHLARRDVPERAREALYELLDVCDQVRYSPSRPSEQAMQSAIHRADQLIDFLGPKLV